ncbi:hypothetical protein VE01_10363 [Pseudogymnoascus verrucosus]|uniref:GABA-specific high-affinity permease n=1 Tax=Pseudogymnoascus verrucosus TaxID=342668 RepID=A0A1B8G6Z8_9PEZI|nr:uncharacterized protein VE01_10363 [Pseudogymnoascus verrucosus]OBT91591.1 hypothetical protein VE01_10363 [Pseudogymnoascus verrucosus]
MTMEFEMTGRRPSRNGSGEVKNDDEEYSYGSRDRAVLANLGKKQALKRNFGFISMVGFSSTLMATWEPLSALLQGGLLNGGPVSLVYGFILCFFGTLATCASLGEMASMSPTSGGQYHWVAQLAPRKYSILLGWYTGWASVLAWLAATAAPAFLGGTLIQGLLVLNDDTYVYERWHGTLLYTAIVTSAVVVNIFGIKILPHLESIILLMHIGLWFLLLIPMVCLAPQHSAEWVFTDFENKGGWSSDGVSWCVGLLTSAFPFTGFDGAWHMSEEIENATTVVPRAMITSIVLNGSLGFGFLIALLFSMGDINAALSTPTGFPIIEIFYFATSSKLAATLMVCGIVFSAVTSTWGLLSAASRMTWAFCRDNGLPYSTYFAHVHSTRHIPIRSIILTAATLLVLGLINIASTAAFYAITGLATVALYSTYIVPIALLVVRRLSGDEIPFGPWHLGRWGMPLNIFSLVYALFVSIWMFFPAFVPVTAVNMNYTSVVYGGTFIFSAVAWYAYGKTTYLGPIKEVRE